MSEVMEPIRITGDTGHDDEFCHIEAGDHGSGGNYCGAHTVEVPHGPDYAGEAICPTCGKSTCPVCAQMESLDARLEVDRV